MTYEEWFIQNLDKFVEAGIVHYNADQAKVFRLFYELFYEDLRQLQQEVTELKKPKTRRKKENV